MLGKLLFVELRGIYMASIIGVLIYLTPKKFNKIILLGILFTLISNIIILFINTFFSETLLIEPIIKSGSNVYEKLIQRTGNILGFEFTLRRSTGFADNLHISALINLFIIFVCWEKKKKFLYWFSILILFSNLNLQFIIIFLVWSYLRTKQFISSSFNFRYIFIGIIILLTLDQLFSFGYIEQILSTNFTFLINEFNLYISVMSPVDFFYGLPFDVEDFYDPTLGYYLPLTDIGFFGIPLQFGFFGVLAIILNYRFWLKYSNLDFNRLLLICLICILHYFPMASFVGTILIFSMMKIDFKTKQV